ncbi:MAG: ribonuclease D [Pikeienuella sp.]
MTLITHQDDLNRACEALSKAQYITIDTEFMRERTYWPKLCLVQLARPTGEWGQEMSCIVDPLVNLDLSPLYSLLSNESVLKVFHAARQDVEIFVNLTGSVPTPIFDTQVAAMVCGYGDQVGYETLVRRIVRESLDKSSRFTDWSRRPLSEKQLTYAIGDVTHLRAIYESLASQLKMSGREDWVDAEMAILRDKATYVVEPEQAWKRVKTRSSDPKFLGIVRALAKWRETEAQKRDVPRGRILKDDAVLEIAAAKPTSREQMLALRSLQKEGRKAETCEAIIRTIAEGVAAPVTAHAPTKPQRPNTPGALALVELLKVLLKAKAEELGVAQRLIASSAELDVLAVEDEPDVPALSGWRREAFGDAALRLKRGEIALSASRKGVVIVELSPK